MIVDAGFHSVGNLRRAEFYHGDFLVKQLLLCPSNVRTSQLPLPQLRRIRARM